MRVISQIPGQNEGYRTNYKGSEKFTKGFFDKIITQYDKHICDNRIC